MEYVCEHNPDAQIVVYGQELNPESYAICKADMLIKGQTVANIKLGNTLSNDQLSMDKFDYMLSNPPFGVDWKKIEEDIKTVSMSKKVLMDVLVQVYPMFQMVCYCSSCTSLARYANRMLSINKEAVSVLS